GEGTLVAQARGYYARAEMMGRMAYYAKRSRNTELSQKFEDIRTNNLNKIVGIFKIDELSSTLLSICAEYLFLKKDYVKALEYSEYVLEHFRSSDFSDYASYVKGEIFLKQGKAKDALLTFKEAVDADVMYNKEKEILLGYAHALVETGDLVAASKVFNDIVTNAKAYKGTDYVAWALFYLGQIEEKRRNPNTAINYYRRCFLTWRKFGYITANAYLRVADIFIQKGDKVAAYETLADMLKEGNPAASEPVAAQARQLQSTLPPPPPKETEPTEPTVVTSAAPAPAPDSK
ncbi:MAG: hypothetical protein LBV54_04420, partial [Puniceicoccales bacterium]|nr:hypothetical protein [Puniceicoccales bacterium]